MEDQYLIDKNRYDEDVKNGIIPEKTLIEKQVWESTLNRSMVLEAENTKLKELLKECKQYIDIWGYTDTHGNLLFPQIEQALGENK